VDQQQIAGNYFEISNLKKCRALNGKSFKLGKKLENILAPPISANQ
jgi:hypothetical protein